MTAAYVSVVYLIYVVAIIFFAILLLQLWTKIGQNLSVNLFVGG